MAKPNAPKFKRWLGSTQVCERYGVSLMWIERRLKKDPDFPPPTYFARIRKWGEDQFDEYDRICAARGRGDAYVPQRPAQPHKPKSRAATAPTIKATAKRGVMQHGQ